MNTLKGAKGCSVPGLSSAPGAIEKLEDTWTLDPDHLLQKSWPVFLKSSTRSLHLLWRNNRLAVMVLIISTQTLGNTWTSHMSFYFKFPTSRAALSSPLSASPSSIFFSSSIFLSFLLLVALNIPGGEAGACTFRFPCILGTPTLLEGISQSELRNGQISVFLHWHHQKSLAHPCAIYFPVFSCLLGIAHILPDYLHLTHLGRSFCVSRTSRPSSTACNVSR